jgi:hypothetical protein
MSPGAAWRRFLLLYFAQAASPILVLPFQVFKLDAPLPQKVEGPLANQPR